MEAKERLEYLSKRFSQEPLANKFGMILKKLEEGASSVTYTADQSDCVTNDRGQGIVQGGVLIGVLADFAAVYAAMASIPGGHTPLMFTSSSLQRPTLAGETVTAEAQVFSKGKTTLGVVVRIVAVDGKIKCEGTYHFYPTDRAKP